MAWRLFNWGSRGLHAEALPGVYVAAIYIPSCIQGTLFCENTGTGQQILHVFDFQGPTPAVSAADCQAVANLLVQWWGINYRPWVATNIRAFRAVGVARDQFEGATWEIAMSTDGLRAGTPNPSEVSLSIKLAGNNQGRSRRGRKFTFPAVTADLVAAGADRFSNLYISGVVGALDQLRTNANTAGYPMKVASNVRAALFPISRVLAVDDLQDSQRRRSAGRGR